MLSFKDIPNYLDQLRDERFYGRVSFDIRNGEIALIRTERTQLVQASKSETEGVNLGATARANGRK